MIERLLVLVYTILYSVALLILLPYEYLKRPKDLRKRWLKERLGFLPLDSNPPMSGFKIWIHSVSVGEVIASVPFIHDILKTFPSSEIILTSVTDTGQKIAAEKLSGSAKILYLPFDLPFSIKRFIKTIRPSLYISIETEIWPNLFHILKGQGIPVLIMNGRISDKSFRGYKRIRFFIKRIFDYVDLFCMQEEVYKDRIKALGVPQERISVTGSFKFDIKINDYRGKWVRYLRGPIILAGSTHDKEEEIILDSFERLKEEFGGMTLIIAPRHPERFSEVEGILKKKGISYIKRSEMEMSDIDEMINSFSVILIDVLGELASLYSICDIAIIGGSFSGRGGHNPLEPAFWGKPIVCGNDMSNFPYINEFYRDGAAINTSRHDLYNDLKVLLLSEDKRINMGKKAKAIYENKSGAIGRSITLLKGYLKLHQFITKEKNPS